MTESKSYWKLFTNTLQLSAFTFGGGYVIVPLMKKQFVDKLHWIDEKQMLDFVAIAQSSPGAMAVNASILVGFHLFGFRGSLVAILGTVLPPLVLLCAISMGYSAFIANAIVRNVLRGMEAGVCAVIVDVVISMAASIVREKSILLMVMMPAAFIAVGVFQVNVMLVILCSVLIGMVTVWTNRGKKQNNDLP